MSILTARQVQQEGLWGETQSLGLQGLHVHLGGEAGVFHHSEPLIPGEPREEEPVNPSHKRFQH